MINGISRIAVTKLDVLDAFDEVKICVGYEVKGKCLKSFPTDVPTLARITPVYESFPGWQQPISAATSYAQLPAAARSYLDALARLTGTRVWLVSVGPRRDQTVTAA
jgi:adenylosuccinate synthase